MSSLRMSSETIVSTIHCLHSGILSRFRMASLTCLAIPDGTRCYESIRYWVILVFGQNASKQFLKMMIGGW